VRICRTGTDERMTPSWPNRSRISLCGLGQRQLWGFVAGHADEVVGRRESWSLPTSKRAPVSVILDVSSEEAALMSPFAGEVAFHEFVMARSPALMRTAYLLTRDHQLAEDLVQTALFKAAKAWDRIEGQPEGYVRRILYTESVSWRRRRRLKEALGDGHDAPARPDADVDLQVSIERALDKLTARQRAVVVLRYYEDLTESATAQTLGIGVGSVKSLHRQALHKLRTCAPHLVELIGARHD
jgi:RNA polymerase sigma-70 factor (sigma-E family)